jgi:ABC-2 type transport system ATP-binding protein
MAGAAITVEGVRFEYPGLRALDDVSFEVPKGSVTALVGPNGAGKTTLLRCIAGLDQPMLGTVRVAGVDVLEEPRAAHRRMGLLSDFFGLYESLTVRQCLAHAAAANGIEAAALAETVNRAAARLDISDKLDARAGALSRGQRQRVAIGQALVHGPEVLLLDEPASGLDPEARLSLAGLFKRLQSEGVSLLVSSHILAELDEYSTHMLVLRGGRIIENRALHEAARPVRRLRLALTRLSPEFHGHLVAQPGVRVLEHDGRGALVELTGDGEAQAALLAALVRAGVPLMSLSEEREDLQASYLRTVRESGGKA